MTSSAEQTSDVVAKAKRRLREDGVSALPSVVADLLFEVHARLDGLPAAPALQCGCELGDEEGRRVVTAPCRLHTEYIHHRVKGSDAVANDLRTKLDAAKREVAQAQADREAMRGELLAAQGKLRDACVCKRRADGTGIDYCAMHATSIERLRETLTEEKVRREEVERELRAVHTDAENVWRWQGGEDHPESLTCPVVMTADTCRALVAARKVPVAPIPMILTCPSCGERHVDRGDFATKPHHTHACQKCGLTWRPAVVPTVGVQHLPGFKDAT